MKIPAPIDAPFTVADADELYGISHWSNGFFAVQPDGDLAVKVPGVTPASLREIVDALVAQGHTLPAILRVPPIIENRIDRLNESFGAAIAEAGFDGHYQGVYPIKVNQRRLVVETVAEHGARWRTGLPFHTSSPPVGPSSSRRRSSCGRVITSLNEP